jgi:hypothetical protein
MNKDKPSNIPEYKKWFKEKHEIDLSNRDQTYYESVTNTIKRDFEKSNFWLKLNENLNVFNQEYLIVTGYPLLILIPKFEPDLYIKPYDSFLLKTLRKNILENKNWPNCPNDGWVLPDNWHKKINDIIRTLFVVKYLDGVEFLIGKIKSLCDQLENIECKVFLEAREEGYYAAHLYIIKEFEIPKIDWDTERINVSIEIQITTKLQEVIRKLLHKYYEERRKKGMEEDIKWQWNYKSEEFMGNYLGHILHYVEGMIMDIRNRQKEDKI